jgi:hypothetical protein
MTITGQEDGQGRPILARADGAGDHVSVSARSVSIIGSFRQFYDDVLRAWRSFATAGWHITSPRGSPIIKPGIPFVRFVTDPVDWDDATVQTATLHRILRADLTYVVAPRGYVGRTTCYELGRIIQANQPVYFSDHPLDLPVVVSDDHVGTAEDVVARLSVTDPVPLCAEQTSRSREWEQRLTQQSYLDL